MIDLLDATELLRFELAQRRESGYEISGVEDTVANALAGGEPAEIERAHRALEETELRPDWTYGEPSGLAEIEATLRDLPAIPSSA